MKKLLVLLLVLLSTVVYAADRHHDRDWTVYQESVLTTVNRVTVPLSGMLRIWNTGADAYIAFNATADAYDIKLVNNTNTDFYPATVTKDDWFTIYSAGNTSINYVILD